MIAWTDIPTETRRDVVEAARADLDTQRSRVTYQLSNARSGQPGIGEPRAIPIFEERIARLDRALAALATLPL